MATANQGYGSASEWLIGQPLTRGKTSSGSIGGGAANTTDIMCVGDSELTVYVDTGGAASTDITVQLVPLIYNAAGATIVGAPITPIRSNGPTFSVSKVQFNGTWDVQGFDRVRLIVTNTTGGAISINLISWQLD